MWYLAFLLYFVAAYELNGDSINHEILKKEFEHPKYSSFDHYWLEEYGNGTAAHTADMTWMMAKIEEARIVCILQGICPTPRKSKSGVRVNCIDGFVSFNNLEYPCNNIDLLSFISLEDLGSGTDADGNDIWGYKDSENNYYAVTGQTNGASIVDITDPINPIVLVFIPSNVNHNVIWRDMKNLDNGYMYIVADGANSDGGVRSGHGIQYFKLDTLIAKGKEYYNEQNTHYIAVEGTDFETNNDITNSHNIIANPSINVIYSCGSRQDQTSNGGIIRYTTNSETGEPTLSGVYRDEQYTHDAECVIYPDNAPDIQYRGKEICFGYQGGPNVLIILEVIEDDNGMATFNLISSTPYVSASYTHQGWLSDDGRYLFLNDEADESRHGYNTRTLLVDLSLGLANPQFGTYLGPTAAIDHNLYVVDNNVFEANYQAGLRVLEINEAPLGLTEIAYFQTWLNPIVAAFNGVWSNYPFWVKETGVVIVQDIEQGLFVLNVNL